MNKRREIFEAWLIKQFGEDKKEMMKDFDEKDGYKDLVINAVWIGFNAGVAHYHLLG